MESSMSNNFAGDKSEVRNVSGSSNSYSILQSIKLDLFNALIAVITFFNFSFTLLTIWAKPDIEFYTPKQVVVFFSDDNDFNLQVAARLAYANKGGSNTFDSIILEKVKFKIEDVERELVAKNIRPFQSERGSLVSDIEKDAAPFALRGGEVASRELSFSAEPRRCHDDDSECSQKIDFISAPYMIDVFYDMAKNNKEIEFKFEAISPDKKSYTAECYSKVTLDDADWLSQTGSVLLQCYDHR